MKMKEFLLKEGEETCFPEPPLIRSCKHLKQQAKVSFFTLKMLISLTSHKGDIRFKLTFYLSYLT